MSVAKKILIVDDNPDLCEILQFHLEELGYHIQTCQSIESAQKTIQANNPFDAIILDLTFPEAVGGIDLISWTRELPDKQKAQSSFILMTGQVLDFSHEKARQLGVNVFMPKPFDPMLLEESLNAAFQKRSMAS